MCGTFRYSRNVRTREQRELTDHDQENWLALYRAALVELEHAQMAGRIKDARTEIVARVEKLQNMPGLHAEERYAIADALSSLRFLEQEEARYDVEEQRHALDKGLEKLRSIAPAILKSENKENKD
jgi:hypothetical protein